MNILENFINIEEKEELVDQLRLENLPLVMWGAGQMADEVSHYLQIKGIDLADVFVDNEYYFEDMFFDEKKVISYTELLKKYTMVNVILGSSNYEKIHDLEERKVVNKVFYLFSASYGVYEKTPISLIYNNREEFERIYCLWEDDISRENYIAFLKTRVSGNNKYIWNVFEREASFFHNDIFQIDAEEVFLDVGAYDGDTIRLFLKENKGKYKRIYALEPDEDNRNKLEEFVKRVGLHDIMVTEKGAWNKEDVLSFISGKNQVSGVSLNLNRVEKENIVVQPLDKIFNYEDKITMMKINYFEGVQETLWGAKEILKVHKPKIAITVGFDCQNIRYIPLIIKEINSDYKLYLRYNRGMASSLTLYGIV